MASQLGYSEFNIKEEKNIDSSNKRKRHNKTIKKKNKKVENFLNSMNNLESMENGEEGLANFTPPPNPVLSKKKHIKKKVTEHDNNHDDDNNITSDYYSSIKSEDINQAYYNQYIPYYEQAAQQSHLHSSKDDLERKLNYMIQLLEENKDEKTENVTEELVLYMFLGIFVIFVVDSFARAGKYTR
jgi:hypothetical protein